MKLDFCVICGSRTELQHHHLVPKIHGGTDDECNLITLCYEHHCWFHEVKPSKWTRQSELIKAGIAKAKLKGVNTGRKVDRHLNALIHQIRSLPFDRPPSYSTISKVLFLCDYKSGKGKPLQREFIYKHYTTWEVTDLDYQWDEDMLLGLIETLAPRYFHKHYISREG